MFKNNFLLDETEPIGQIDIIVTAVLFGSLILAYYLLYSIAVYRLSKKSRISFPGIAFIPFFWGFMLGRISGKFQFFGIKFRRPHIWALVFGFINLIFVTLNASVVTAEMLGVKSIYLDIISSVLVYTSMPSFLIFIAYNIVLANIFYNVYIKYTPLNAQINTILSLFWLAPIFLLVAGSNEPTHRQNLTREETEKIVEKIRPKDPFDGLGL